MRFEWQLWICSCCTTSRRPPLPPSAFAQLTTVGVDAAVVQEADPQVVQHSRLMEKAESCQVVLTLQDVRVPQRGEVRRRTHWVMELLFKWIVNIFNYTLWERLEGYKVMATTKLQREERNVQSAARLTFPSGSCSSSCFSPGLKSCRSWAETHTDSGSGTHTLEPWQRSTFLLRDTWINRINRFNFKTLSHFLAPPWQDICQPSAQKALKRC